MNRIRGVQAAGGAATSSAPLFEGEEIVRFFRIKPPFYAVGVAVICQTGVSGVIMTIILFLVDTSASMNQRTYLGTTLIDVAKAAVETFMKVTDVKIYFFRTFRCTDEYPFCFN